MSNTKIQELIDKMPEGLRARLPEELKRDIEDNPDDMTLVKILMFVAKNKPKKPTQEDYDEMQETLDTITKFIDNFTTHLPMTFSIVDNQRVSDMSLQMYQTCQRFCAAYNKEDIKDENNDK